MSGVELTGLGKRFGERTAVEGLTFTVEPGEVFGLLGPNGAGKTTTVRMLTGLLRPTSGHAVVAGLDVAASGSLLRARVGLLTETPGLYERLTARDNLRFFIRLHMQDEKAAWRRAEHYLERFGLGGREHEPCGGFSKGMRQKLALVRALVHDPKVLFLDEPTSGLDPEAARTVRDAIAELASDGRCILLCSHNLPEVERLCRRVAVVKRSLRALATVGELRRAGVAVELGLEGQAEVFVPLVNASPFPAKALAEGKTLRVLLDDEARVPDVVTLLVQAGARVHQVQRTQRPLEEVYLELVRDGGPNEAATVRGAA